MSGETWSVADARARLSQIQLSIDIQIGAAGAAQYAAQGTSVIRAPLSELRAMEREIRIVIDRLVRGGASTGPAFTSR